MFDPQLFWFWMPIQSSWALALLTKQAYYESFIIGSTPLFLTRFTLAAELRNSAAYHATGYQLFQQASQRKATAHNNTSWL